MNTAILKKGEVTLIPEVFCFETFSSRLVGLMGRRSLGLNRAAFLAPCSGVHTCFMRFSLDLVFITRDWQVAGLYRDVHPWRMEICRGRGWGVFEIESGWFPRDALQMGDRISLVGFGTR